MTADIIASIDDTLAGYEGAVSAAGGDMMRWTPERVICDGGRPMMPAPMGGLRFGMLRQDIIGRVPEFPPVPPPRIIVTVDTGQFAQSVRALAQVFAGFAADAVKTMPAVTRLMHLMAAPDRKHHARCRTCNPSGNPEPLAIDGREYNRRRKARQRRKR